jgi:hypothetical protein
MMESKKVDIKNLWLWSVQMWQESSAQSSLFRLKTVFFAQWGRKISPGRKIWAKNNASPVGGMT